VQEGQRVAEGEVIARWKTAMSARPASRQLPGSRPPRPTCAGRGGTGGCRRGAEARARTGAEGVRFGAAVDTAEARFNKAQAAIKTLQAQIAVAQANLRATQVSFDQTLIRAPFTGIVLTKNANVGDILTPFSSAAGTTGAVVTMADMSTLEVEADVSEASIAKISVGQPAEIQLDAFTELRLAGSVSRIVPTVDRSKATLLVKVKFEETDPACCRT